MDQRSVITPKAQQRIPWFVGPLVVLYLGLLAALVLLSNASLLARLRWLDSGVCAQLASHSFYPGGEQLPLCARNTGIYLGFITTLVILHATGRGRSQRVPRWPILLVLLTGVLVLAIDGFNSFALDLHLPHLYQPYNLVRLATGLVTGLAMAALVLPLLNRLFWCEYNEQRSIPSWNKLLLYIPALLLCFFAVASQSTLVLYPVALLSTTGLLTAAGSVNLIIVVAVSRRDETFLHYRELLPFFGLALLLAIGEMLILAQLKLTLLHTIGMHM